MDGKWSGSGIIGDTGLEESIFQKTCADCVPLQHSGM